MRKMKFTRIPQTPDVLEENVVLLTQRRDDSLPYPSLSYYLIGYMAWPEEKKKRNWLILTQLAQLISGSGAELTTWGRAEMAFETFELLGGFAALAEAANYRMEEELERAQRRWARAAAVLQFVVDLDHAPMRLRGGASISKAIDLTQRRETLPTRTVFVNSWSAYRNVAHLLAASVYLSAEANKIRPGHSPLAAARRAPEAVIRLAASYQHFCLTHRSHGQGQTLLDPDVLWRVPVPDKLLPIPAQPLCQEDLFF
jgi:hypothetical protein